MSFIPDHDQAAGVRRAAAFLLHHGARDVDGVNAVLSELVESKDSTGFVLSMAVLFETVVPLLYSAVGQVLVRDLLHEMAGIENGGRS